jgi:eukaryotic-like serine/threonine-protein kinase
VSTPQEQAEPVAGDAFDGRYEVVAPISSGAMGAVYRALDREAGREVAVKRLLDVRHAARFEIEARLLASLSHPRLVKVLDHASDEHGAYIVMELVEGIDLGAMLKRDGDPGLTVGDSIEFARHGCEALQYVHDQQILHRDVKPENLILCDGEIVLVDFGISQLHDPVRAATIGVGTPGYIAPEVAFGGRTSPRSDVYGLAATLWTLIVGNPPLQSLRGAISTIAPQVSPALESTLAAGLEDEPARRIASADAFARALGAPLETSGSSLALSVESPAAPRNLVESVVRAAARIFDAASASIALRDPQTGELVYTAAWGAAADEIVGVRLAPGAGLAGAVATSGEPLAIPDCRNDPRWESQIAESTGYIPHTMLIVPLLRGTEAVGALSILDRRDGEPYDVDQIEAASLFAEIALSTIAEELPA